MNDVPARSPYDPPRAPYPDLPRQALADLERMLDAAGPPDSPFDGAPAALHGALREHVEASAADLCGLSHAIHGQPELGFEERAAARAVTDLLTAAGVPVEVGACGLDTAVRARIGRRRPRVALLAEYDALPGIGHACGHNIIAATAVGAFLALAAHIDTLGGSVELIGCPAEEGGGGKEFIARAGGFDDVDAALMLHPAGFDAAAIDWLGVRQVEAVFHGLSAHAAAMPQLGRNALDGAVAAYQGVAALRQHMLPGDRVHGIITDGGQAPNVVPARAAVRFYLRSSRLDTLAELTERAREVCEGAALASGTQLALHWDPCPVYVPVRNSATLAGRYAVHAAARGRRVLPPGQGPTGFAASTDLGNVSVRVPAIHPTLAVAPPEVSLHTPAFADWAVSAQGDTGVVDGAVALAQTAADLLVDEQLQTAMRREFEDAGGVIDVVRDTAPPGPR